MAVRLLLIVNASASSVTARTRVKIQTLLTDHHDVELALTSRRGHAARLARGAANTGFDAVVVLGGDGTLNEAANGLAGTECALAALPGGSTNVFARSIGTPDDPLEATGRVVAALAAGSIESIGLGEVDGRYFLFHCGIGFDASVVAQVERRSALKRYAGHPLFVWAGFDTWFRHYDRRSPSMRVTYPGSDEPIDTYLTIVLNSDPYTYLGSRPLSLAPDATLDRGLAVIGVKTMSFGPMLGLVASMIRGNDLRSDERVHYRADVEQVSVTSLSAAGVDHQVDGDHLGATSGLEFRWVPDAVRLVRPSS